MVTLKGLILTLKTTRNFWDVVALRNSEGKRRITFRNAFTIELNWNEYRTIRELLSNGYVLEEVEGLPCFRKGKIKIVCPISFIDVLKEHLDEVYNLDCKNKVVLDVGGFIGETAVYFSRWEARKVIIYEPVAANHKFIKMNITLNGVDAELHEEGIGDEDGYRIIHYDAISPGLGLSDEGEHEMKLKIRNVRNVIEESHADIAKFDCEGAEESLIRVPDEVLRKIDFYIIEVHTPEIRKAIMDKFKSSGFSIVKELSNENNEEISIVFFQRV